MRHIPGRKPLPEADEVWAEHVAALQAFLAIAGQWRCQVLPNGRLLWLGLDYAAAQAALALSGLQVTPQIWGEVRLIEASATEELNNRV